MKTAASLRITIAALLGGGLTLLVALLYLFDPRQHGFYPRCMLHELTGWHCAGCGSLRATHALLHGDVLTALHCNVLLVGALGSATTWLGYRLWRNFSSRPLQPVRFDPLAATWLLLGVTLAFSIVRNLPLPVCAGLNP